MVFQKLAHLKVDTVYGRGLRGLEAKWRRHMTFSSMPLLGFHIDVEFTMDSDLDCSDPIQNSPN